MYKRCAEPQVAQVAGELGRSRVEILEAWRQSPAHDANLRYRAARVIGYVARNTVRAEVKEIAQQKMKDLNCESVDSAMRMIEGSARSMGLEVRE